jgi:hypothetical protein
MEPEKELLKQQNRRLITALFKSFLGILQEIQQKNLTVIVSLSKQFPPDFVNKVNIIDFPEYSRLRKRVLDDGNGAIREIESLINSFDITIHK